MTPRFVLAKYAPDLARMEPRNIGVFVWWKGEIKAKFLSADAVDGLADSATYERWTTYWNRMIASDSIRPKRGKPVGKQDPSCLDALLTTQKGNYILVDSGELMRKVRKAELQAVVEFLFNELVASPKHVRVAETEKSFPARCESLLARTGVSEREDFREKYPVDCAVYGMPKTFHFSYGLGNGKPNLLIQRVKLSSEQSVESSALKIHELIERRILPKECCAALIQTSHISSRFAEQGRDFLRGLCMLVDVEDPSVDAHVQSLLAAI